MERELEAFEAPDTRTRWEKLTNRLFPHKHCFAPEAPSDFKDCIHGEAVTKFSWADRLRILVTGTVVMNWCTVTENKVGRNVTNVTVYVSWAKDCTAEAARGKKRSGAS
jgi:hypothetical protein